MYETAESMSRAEFSVFRMGSGNWAVGSRHLATPLVFPARQLAFECACDLAMAGRVEVRDAHGALISMMDLGDGAGGDST